MTVTQQIDPEMLQALVAREPLVVAGQQFGDAGSERIKSILRFLKKCAHHATVHERSDIMVFALMQTDALVEQRRIQHATRFQYGVSARGTIEQLMVEIREDGSPFLWSSIPADVSAATQTGIVYRLVQCVETFLINGTSIPVPKVIPSAISQFCLNYFTELKDALIAYRDSMARTSKCHLLRRAWAEEKRLWFDTKPEYRLRRALHNYLYSFLRHDDIDLREEQNVDDSHPVDLKVVWRMENRSAIIEVKWVGKSIDLKTRKITGNYTDARARKGARQLAEYLEWNRQQAAKEDTRGYLVVFDCRRKHLKPTATAVAKAEGLHYRNREITYKPEFHKIRHDFEEPLRIFLEPVFV
ncbi:MAG: hypothetical protein NT011_10640 [Kiritimatiellaeota bacterium]|nr:hypothetical protein [Kiritimatiellota bacterium]